MASVQKSQNFSAENKANLHIYLVHFVDCLINT